MKKQLLLFVALFVLAATALVSCQDEENRVVTGEGQLSKTSPLTQNLQNLTANKTGIDNVIDSTSCFSVELPVQILVSGEPFTVESQEDYALVEDLLQSSPIGATIDFVFPVTVTDANYNQTTVSNPDEFEALSVCEAPPTIACLTINYPIAISAYDSGTQTPTTQTIDNDHEFFTFLFALPDTSVYEIAYPITVVNSLGVTVDISNNEALNAAIATAGSDCACDNPNILTDDLIIYIPFANEIADLTGFSTPQQQGEVAFVADRSDNPGGALSFLGGGQVNNIIVPGNPDNNLVQTNAFSISLWFNRQDTQNLGVEELFGTEGFLLGLGNPNAPSDIRNPFMSTPNVEYTPDFSWQEDQLLGEIGQWHHLVVTWDGDLVRLYRDGELGALSEIPEFPTQMLGAVLGGNYRGFLDDVRVYKRALNAAEVVTLFELEGDINTCLE